MVPKRANRDHHIHAPYHEIEDEKEKVSLVLHADTIIDPRAMVIHQVYAPLTDTTVMRACRFDHATRLTLFRPKLFKLCNCFASISEQSLDVFR